MILVKVPGSIVAVEVDADSIRIEDDLLWLYRNMRPEAGRDGYDDEAFTSKRVAVFREWVFAIIEADDEGKEEVSVE
jgi:hypothetical protein